MRHSIVAYTFGIDGNIFNKIILFLCCRCLPSLAFWRVDNSVGTFLPADPSTYNLMGRAYDFRHMLFGFQGVSSNSLGSSNVQASECGNSQNLQSERSAVVNSGRRFEAVASFRLIWWNQGSNSRKKLSIWRPVVPLGMIYFGDIAVNGYFTCGFVTFYELHFFMCVDFFI